MSNNILIYLLFATLFGTFQSHAPSKSPPNVLFIAIDDLRPELNCYGKSYMHTPHLDQLASESRLFNQHFVQVPTCGASRFALLMGQYPRTVKHTSNQVFRNDLAEAKQSGLHTLPQVYKAGGYHTSCIGKISHYVDGKIYTYEGEGDGRWEMPDSWDVIWGPTGKWGTAWNAFFAYADGSNRNARQKEGPATEFVAEGDEDLPDGLIAARAIEELKARKASGEPFFMSVGFFKPHLPFVAPKKYWDLYEGRDLPLSPIPNLPEGIAPMAIHKSGEMFNNYRGQAELGGLGVRISDEHAMHLRRAYFAAVSYTDALVGKLINALKETGLDKNTIVVVWGDHGWHLGDQTVWGKHTLSDWSLRSALMIRTPEMKHPGRSTAALAETIDLYPTLLQLSELEPLNPLSGKSLVPVLNDPTAQLDQEALGFWRMGYSLRTPRYRLTRYQKGEQIDFDLFDYQLDPQESRDFSKDESHEEILRNLKEKLHSRMPASYQASLQ